MAELVTAEEYVDRLVEAVCGCGHMVGDHVGAGCYSRQTTSPDPRGYCPCMKSPKSVMVSAVDQLVRVKMAAELERLGDTTMRLYRNMLHERAEEIRNA